MKEKNAKKIYPIKVCILEDDEAYKDTLKEVLSQDDRIKVYGEYSLGARFIQDLNSPFEPDVCLIDIRLADNISGMECARQIKEKNAHIHVIIMTAYPDSQSLAQSKTIGADYIQKGTIGEVLVNKIITHFNFSKKEQIISINHTDEKDSGYIILLAKEIDEIKKRAQELSYYQREVLRLRKADKSINEIADLLNMKNNTVRTHLERGLKKLNLPKILKYIDL